MTKVKSNGYTIHLGKNVFKSLSAFLTKNNYSSYFIVCDENTLIHCLPALITSCPELSTAEIIEIESGESSKSLEFSAHIWQTLLENEADKKTLLLNLGGGVVSDLGGFTASVYKRGVDFINLPTSLLAMADASVGGKTGIDFSQIKNVIGTFTQPKAVFIYPPFLDTLPARHFQNGLAEVYKAALIGDKKLWQTLKTIRKTEVLIRRSVDLKNKIVLKDPFDKGIRNILNFGHTFGHALESLLLGTPHELLHGEAIVAGMIMESHLAFQKKLLSKDDFFEIVAVLSSHFKTTSLGHLSFEEVNTLLKNDKKTSRNTLYFSLLSGIGTCKYGIKATEAQVRKAFDYYLTLHK